MTSFRSLAFAALFLASAPVALVAQEVVQPLGPTDADALAIQMRQLAANPRDLHALATAGELSLKLGDFSGAAALFARADKVDPRSGRVKAGMASILVRSERPGEALRFFQQAESYGWDASHFAADRGLAYDLVGEGARAQRDYQLALRAGRDDETVRRYALSLGIAGRQAEALEQLDPLVRRQDRAAWRARAFILAMSGDTNGAAKIANAMMPAAMTQGLGAFFQRLPGLSATDRAFAVHFGEIYATPERLADARLAPVLTPLPASASTAAPVQVAAAAVPQPRSQRAPRRRDRQQNIGREPVQVAARTAPAAVSTPAAAPVATATAVQPRPVAPVPVVTPAPQIMREADVRVAAASPSPSSARPASAQAPNNIAQASLVATRQPGSAASPAVAAAAASPATVTRATPPVQLAAVSPASTTAVAPPAPVRAAAAPMVATVASPANAVAPIESEAATPRTDSVLARIVASLTIPAAELGVFAPDRPEPAPAAIPPEVERAPASPVGERVVAEASAKEARDAAVRRTVAEKLTGDPAADEQPTRTGRARERIIGKKRNEAEELASAEAKGSSKAKLANSSDKSARQKEAAAKLAKAKAEKKVLADRAEAEKKASRANPSRIWVQVAGGANEGDLGRAWAGVKKQASALAGKTGYSTPLRATNRVLTGPFKTNAEARAFVNQLAKQGVSAFPFTSEAGQEVTRLGK